jgi:hypothetical protein
VTDAVFDWRLEQLDHRHRDPLLRLALLAEQQEGAGWFSVVVSSDGEVLGRVTSPTWMPARPGSATGWPSG